MSIKVTITLDNGCTIEADRFIPDFEIKQLVDSIDKMEPGTTLVLPVGVTLSKETEKSTFCPFTLDRDGRRSPCRPSCQLWNKAWNHCAFENLNHLGNHQ